MLRDVERGEQVRVTVRGRVVADLVPAGPRRTEDRVRTLVAEGKVTPASRALPRRPPRMTKAGHSASAIVLAERDEER